MSDRYAKIDLTNFILPGEEQPRFASADVPLQVGMPFATLHLIDGKTSLRFDLNKQVIPDEGASVAIRAVAPQIARFLRANTPTKVPLRVFISYSWDSSEHSRRVLGLAQRLRTDGIDAWIDRFETSPAEGWGEWSVNQMDEADYVLAVITENYARRLRRTSKSNLLGNTWEGAIIREELLEYHLDRRTVVPVVFGTDDSMFLPPSLSMLTTYDVSSEVGYDALYRLLTGQPGAVPVPLGELRQPASTQITASPLRIPKLHYHSAGIRSNLPRLPSFFGREQELKKIADALSPNARTWGVLIDGPGGIGKTSLAIRAAELVPPGSFRRILFLSAKERELMPDGTRSLHGFVIPGYIEMLNEIARQTGRSELTKSLESERASLVLAALEDEQSLLVLDNLETLSIPDREHLFAFLNRLPRGCKAIVTSRRRSDIDARLIRLDRLDAEAARALIEELAIDYPQLASASEKEVTALYEETGGNPLLLRWAAGQLGRGRCHSIQEALEFLRNAPPQNDPLEFVFGDLLDAFSDAEIKVLAALTNFSEAAKVEHIAELGGLSQVAAQTALDDLADRGLIMRDAEAEHFALVRLVAEFLRRKRPGVVAETGDRLEKRAYAIVIENGYEKYDRFPILEDAWPTVEAALPRFVAGPNDRLQTICDALRFYLEFTGRWDEWAALESEAEHKAVAAKDFVNAGWRAFQTGWIHYLRGQAAEVLVSADRAEAYWNDTKASGARERSFVFYLRGVGYHMTKDHEAATKAYREAIEPLRALNDESAHLAMVLNALASSEKAAGNLDACERDYREALRISQAVDYREGVAYITGNLAELALERQDWHASEILTREALLSSERIGRRELIASQCRRLAVALLRQEKKSEALPYARRAVEIFGSLRSPQVKAARAVLRSIES
ncbi:MAG TPA: TIR domain-containing protein [Chthoniobacterales bacterium]|jgi:tetratricopeptide (TPR) repeat protein|nr:TIR domain-containing protein [Chthoniobacterales bacterium]